MMKCLAVFNSLPDLSYLWIDREFQNHLCKNAVKIGLADPASSITDVDEETILSYAGQFFSPLVTSNKYMREVNNSYQSMICENGFIIAMNQLTELSELYFVALCGDGEESELYLQRKISFVHRMLLFTFGPCAVDHLKPSYRHKRRQTWRILNEWLLTWQTLCQQEQMYLVESLERLHVNQELNSVSLNLLGEVLARSNKDGHTMHSLLLVNNKLLGLYSSERSLELRAADILLLICLIKKKFKYDDDLVPKSLYRTPPPFCDKSKRSKDDKTLFEMKKSRSSPLNINSQEDRDSGSSSKLEFHSAPSSPPLANDLDGFFTPRKNVPSTSADNQSLDYDLTMSEADLEILSQSLDRFGELELTSSSLANSTPFGNSLVEEEFGSEFYKKETEEIESSEESNPEKIIEEVDHEIDSGIQKTDNRDSIITLASVGISTPTSATTTTTDEQNEATDKAEDVMFHESIFLQAGDSAYAPYTAHCLLLGNATVLVMLSQHRQMYLAFYIQHLLRSLNSMLKINKHKQLSYRTKLLEDTEKFIHKIQLFFFRNSETQTDTMALCFKNFEQSWKLTQDAGLVSFINSETVSIDMSTRLESGITGLLKSIKSLFTHLFIFSSQRQGYILEKQKKTISLIRDIALRRLSHYDLFLNVRGQQNVTMTAYHNDFPGLIHFIYVNRTTDQLIAPTVNVNMDSNDSMYILIKQRIWDFWQYSEVMVSNGYTAFVVRDGDYSFSYFMWFEDMLGKPMISQKSLKGLNENKPTGILSGHFYKNVLHYLFPTEAKGSVNCYELFSMHVGLVTNQFIATSCKKLARILWEGCGEPNSDLL